jgi:predicted kinase
MPRLFVLIGPPGAGKSTWRARHLAKYPNTAVISQDDLVDAFAAQRGITYSHAFRIAPMKEFAATVKIRFKEAVERGDDIILDRTNMRRKARHWFLNAARGYQTTAVVFHTDPIVLEDRLHRRGKATGKFIPANVVQDMLCGYEPPDLAEFDSIKTIRSGPPTFKQKLRHVLRQIREFLP